MEAALTRGAAMFEIHCVSPLDNDWERREKLILAIICRQPDHSEAGARRGEEGRQSLMWLIDDFCEAVRLRRKLANVRGVLSVTVREAMPRPERRGRK